jgi:hypothetical protein
MLRRSLGAEVFVREVFPDEAEEGIAADRTLSSRRTAEFG